MSDDKKECPTNLFEQQTEQTMIKIALLTPGYKLLPKMVPNKGILHK